MNFTRGPNANLLLVVLVSSQDMWRSRGAVRLIVVLAAVGVCLPGRFSFAAPDKQPPTASATQPLLPTDFAGWHLASSTAPGTAPQAADAGNADVLKEYGFSEFASGSYARDDNKLSVRAMSFQDASGAYGAYTFYRRPGARKEEIGAGAAFDGTRVLFWKGAIVVDATFDHLTAMSAAELRELANALPQVSGNASIPPSLPRYLPTESLDPQTTRYALGDAGYTRGGGVLPPSLIDFGRDAEALTAHYSSRDGEGYLTVVSYPTPQLAAERERAIGAFFKTGNTPQAAWPQALAESNPASLLVRRSGPLVIVSSGGFSASQAHKLLSQVNYVADVTWNRPEGYISEASKTARLVLGIAALCGILMSAAVLLGLFFGGGRALYRVIRGKPVSTLNDEEFISLKLGRD